jgi:hypothetical protein
MEEPSVLDYVKSLLHFWKEPVLVIPEEKPVEGVAEQTPSLSTPDDLSTDLGRGIQNLSEPETFSVTTAQSLTFPWKVIASIILAGAGQWLLSPVHRSPVLGLLLLAFSISLAVWANLSGEWRPPVPIHHNLHKDSGMVNRVYLVMGIIFGVLTFISSGGNRIGFINLITLVLSIFFILKALWLKIPDQKSILPRCVNSIRNLEWKYSISPWILLFASAIILILYLRTAKLDLIPPEMVSDHAEKYLDVFDILGGNYHIFFPRNGGREALQFYLLTALIEIFNAPISFLTLKISSVIIGLLALPFIYFFGLEIGGKRVGLFSLIFAGISYWLNVISRAGMRLPFYVLFTAAVLYFLIKGLRSGNRNDFLVSGLALGVGMYGYSANRILPLAVIAAVLLYIMHRESAGRRLLVLYQALMLFLTAIIVSLPLLRYSIQDPSGFGDRMWSRMSVSATGQPFEIVKIFLTNTWKALSMLSWSGGVVWVTSIPDYPAIGIAAGALFYTGAVLIVLRYILNQNWLDLFLLLSIPILMLPSILSLAFPSENPNLYRTGGAAVIVFLIIAISLDSLMRSLENRIPSPWGIRLAWSAFAVLILISAFQNHDLVFNKYYQQYRLSAQNTSEMGKVIRGFVDAGGSPGGVWVMGYPHWADTRLVAINAGYPKANFALFSDKLIDTLEIDPPKLFIIHPDDKASLDALPRYYENGWLYRYDAAVEGKDFMVFTVPPSESDHEDGVEN